MAKKTIATIVAENESVLKTFTTHTQLRKWATEQGFDNRSAFPKFKDALLLIGINYEGIRSGIQNQEKKDLENAITQEVTLYCDAKASAGKFGICDRNGNVLWYGNFFDNDDAGEQSRAELAAAKKAVWFASKVKEAINAEAIRLNLIVDAQWLTYQSHAGQKGYVLTQMCRKSNIELNVEWISGKDNPADEWTTARGFKKWQENNLASLAAQI